MIGWLNWRQRESMDGWKTWTYKPVIAKAREEVKWGTQTLTSDVREPVDPFDWVIDHWNGFGTAPDGNIVLMEPVREESEEVSNGRKCTELIKILWGPMYGSQWENMLPHAEKVINALRDLAALWRDLEEDDITKFLWEFDQKISIKGEERIRLKRIEIMKWWIESAMKHVATIPVK